jgi:hypothetical protein
MENIWNYVDCRAPASIRVERTAVVVKARLYFSTSSLLYALKYSVEVPTRCSFVIEFTFPKFIDGSTCFEQHTAHHQEL